MASVARSSNQPIGRAGSPKLQRQQQTQHLQFQAASPETTSLAAFTKRGSLLSRRDQNQLKDADSSASTTRASCLSTDCSDCSNDLHWDELSTSSSSDLELEAAAWQSSPPCPSPGGVSKLGASPAAETGRPMSAWGEPRMGARHTFRHPIISQSPPAGPTLNSWGALGAANGAALFRRAQRPVSSPVMVPQRTMRRSASSRAQDNKQAFAVGSPLQLTPVHLAALAAASSPSSLSSSLSSSPVLGSSPASSTSSTTSSGFAPRLRPVVHPINIGPPTEYDFRNTNGLMKCLNAMAPLPTPEALSAKHLVISELQRTVDQWMCETFPEEKETTATLLLGGSWHLKVGLGDSDIDVVALLPNFVTSECFFSSLHEYLKLMPSVSKLVAMSKAAVPILAFQLNGVRIDLLFARFTQNVVPKNLPIHSDQILAGMDATSIRSLSVPRVASLILELVPNDSAFRSCLRIIRLWAKRRGIYSNKAGFLGGVSWTILVAFICQMFPKATISSVIHRFFSILSTWNWPTPILLSKPYECAGIDSSVQWCPQKNHHDRAHVMPIITPGFPAVNSAVNVNASTLRILKEEFERGKHIMDEMLAKGLSSPAVWQKLFTPSEFLVRYDHYVVVELTANSEDELSEWSNYVSSRTRKLVESLEHTAAIHTVHPFPDLVTPVSSKSSSDTASAPTTGYYFVGYTTQTNAMSPNSRGRRPFSVQAPGADDSTKESVASAARYFNATELDKCLERKEGMAVKIKYSRWQELPESIFAQGRQAAAGERARFILSRAHNTHVALGLGR